MTSLKLTYHIVFLSIFVLTAITALGSVIKWGPFRKVTPGYTKLLFSSLILEVVAAVISMFVTPPDISNERYEFKMRYYDYLPALKAQFPDDVKACIDNYLDTGLFPDRESCNHNGAKTLVCAYIRADILLNHNSRIGQGLMYLTRKAGTAHHDGLLGYRFPGANDSTLIEVSTNVAGNPADSEVSTKNLLNLRFDQQDNLVEIRKAGSIDKQLTKHCAQRVHQPFDIQFVQEDPHTYIGELKPNIAGDKEIVLGIAKLIRI